jgi:hypothetical protein
MNPESGFYFAVARENRATAKIFFCIDALSTGFLFLLLQHQLYFF